MATKARKQEIADAVNRVRALVAEYGLTPQDVFSSRKAVKTRSGGKVALKYRDPATGSTWTGRGKVERVEQAPSFDGQGFTTNLLGF